MKYIITLSCMVLLSLTTKSQNTTIDRMAILDSLKNPHLADSVYKFVDQSPSFPNGDYGWSHYLTKNVQYPQAAQDSNIQGNVAVRFIVEKNGNTLYPLPISGPEVFYEEVIRLIKKSHWKPAKINGKEVNAYHKVTIGFKLAL